MKGNNNKLMVAFLERHHSLLQDGYRDVIISDTYGVHYCKMRHANGNYVSLTAYPDDNVLVQRSNGVIVHEEKMC